MKKRIYFFPDSAPVQGITIQPCLVIPVWQDQHGVRWQGAFLPLGGKMRLVCDVGDELCEGNVAVTDGVEI